MQLGLPPETNKRKGSNLIVEEEILLFEEILKYEGTMFGKIWGLKGEGGIVKRKKSIWKAIAAILTVDSKSNVRN